MNQQQNTYAVICRRPDGAKTVKCEPPFASEAAADLWSAKARKMFSDWSFETVPTWRAFECTE